MATFILEPYNKEAVKKVLNRTPRRILRVALKKGFGTKKGEFRLNLYYRNPSLLMASNCIYNVIVNKLK